jgi:hypothetical protein
MQGGGAQIGKRKRAVLMTRSVTGEYRTIETAPQPDDEHEELAPIPVPVHIDLETSGVPGDGSDESGVRTVSR